MIEDIFHFIAFMSVALLCVLIIFGGLYSFSGDAKKDNDFHSGKITEAQYCQTFADQATGVPVRCYKYFGVHQIGTQHVQHGKTSTEEPILVAD